MYSDISSEDFREQFVSGESGEYQFIDVREEEEHAEAHIPGATNIPLSEFMARVDDISEDSPVLLVCNTGVRSAQAAMFLVSMGYEDVYNLEEGTKGWMKKGYAVESVW
jgi:rhodanese-related sulfurtransferase